MGSIDIVRTPSASRTSEARLAEAKAKFGAAEYEWNLASVRGSHAEAQRALNAYVSALDALRKAKEAADGGV